MYINWFGLQTRKNKKRCLFCACNQHVQCAAQINFLCSVVMPLSICAIVLSLVSLAQKFTKSEDPMFKKVFPLRHVLLVPLITRHPNVFPQWYPHWASR